MSQPWPPGDEPGNSGGLDMGTVKEDGQECAREWPGAPPGADYYDPPPVDDGSDMPVAATAEADSASAEAGSADPSHGAAASSGAAEAMAGTEDPSAGSGAGAGAAEAGVSAGEPAAETA